MELRINEVRIKRSRPVYINDIMNRNNILKNHAFPLQGFELSKEDGKSWKITGVLFFRHGGKNVHDLYELLIDK